MIFVNVIDVGTEFLEKLMNQIVEQFSALEPEQDRIIDLNKIYITQAGPERMWCRVKVIEILDNINVARVMSIDMGFIELVSCTILFLLEDVSKMLSVYPEQVNITHNTTN